ncbi:hypothetical protein BJY24_007833 [Nocardia transvalensis]|uniref:Uncharacterized protein n=1 Tax=Nocardia transvalensis TaxID=37333 RepID=A0A7W9PMQ8_9NOCA|nr:hypothetical protein [Nocardia transvalensis]MBB5918921.1 hypothetical protein [Nocardia transvalensis]
MIGTLELRQLAARARIAGDSELAEFATRLARRREHDYDAAHLAPLLHGGISALAVWPAVPFDELPEPAHKTLITAAGAIRERLELHGWTRPETPGRRWEVAAQIPDGARFTPTCSPGYSLRRAGDQAVDDPCVPMCDGPGQTWQIGTLDDVFSAGYIEVLA